MWLAHVVDATPRKGWGGGDVNVPCDLLTLLMLRHAGVGVGGMLTFHVTCSRCWCYATQGLGWGGMLTFHVTCSRCWCYATQGLGWGGGMLTFHVTCSRCWCYATQGLGWGGGDVNVPCDLLTLLMLRHAGVGVGWGGDVNVPCDLLSLLMLRHARVGVGGMLTFHVTCSGCWCYATQGLGWGGC